MKETTKKSLIRDGIGCPYRWAEHTNLKTKDIFGVEKYADYKFIDAYGRHLHETLIKEDKYNMYKYVIADFDVIEISDEKKIIRIDCDDFDVDRTVRKNHYKVLDRHAVKEAEKYLASPFAKGWLKKMQYTIKEDEYGHKFLFLAILCGYNKINSLSFQKLCNAICRVNFHDKLRMRMWIGGKVNWTMFYQRPDHVNGQETYFCGVVGKDNYSPDDFDKDHSEYSFKSVHYIR